MAFIANHNINGSAGVDVQLIQPGDNTAGIKSILLTNTRDSDTAATVTLFIQDDPPAGVATSTFNILKKVSIPRSTSLLLDDAALLSFNGNVYGLYINVGTSDTLDVLINR